MQVQRKRNNGIFYAVLFCVAIYIGYCIGTRETYTMENLSGQLTYALTHPLPFRITKLTRTTVMGAILVWLLVIAKLSGDRRNYRSGEEYGSSRIAEPQELNKHLAEPEPNRNKICSENLRISLNTRKTALNNNMLVIGGSGAGKSFYIVKPNIYNLESSYIICDPKGEILRDTGAYLEQHGYRIRVLNLVEMSESDHYNPFSYIRKEEDVIKLITNLIANTTPKNSSPNDPFWEKAESMLLQAIMFYVWYEYPKQGKTPCFRALLELLNKAQVAEKKGAPSELDRIMYRLPADHPALVAYKKVATGAADTVRSIIISAHSRLSYLQNDSILRILDSDDLDIRAIGEGVYQNPDRRTALFCVIPDAVDKSYSFLVGLLYTQIFQELYYVADHDHGGLLPVHVALWMDEFANVALPDDFCQILSTVRSRNISCNIIVQNMAQLKELFKDSWETIPGNCDVLVYLGGNEQSTHEYISKMLGKGTIDKRTTGETLGNHGSSSRNYDVLGRELLLPEEVRKTENSKCLVFVKGYDAVFDDKYRTWEKPEFKEAQKYGPYSKKADAALLEEGRCWFYICDRAEENGQETLAYQVEQYAGVFEESPVFSKLKETKDGKYYCPPDGKCVYQSFESLEMCVPVFKKTPEVVRFPGSRLYKHPITGFMDGGGKITPLEKEEVKKIFAPGLRVRAMGE